jgi:tetratricopeptide (TPR) repeat protein
MLMFAALLAAGCGKPGTPSVTAPPVVTPGPLPGPGQVPQADPMAVVKKVDAALAAPDGVDWAALEKECTQAVEKNAKPDFLAARGSVRAKLGRDDEAMADFEAALRLAADRHEWRRRRLDLLERRKMWAELSLDLDYLVGLDEKDLALRLKRAKARLAGGEWARAVEDYRLLVEAQPDNEELRFARAKAAVEAGDRELAVADVSNILAKKPSADLYAHRGEIQWRFKIKAKAREDFEKGLELDPKNVRCLIGLIEVVVKEEPPKAVELATRAIEIDEKSTGAWYLRGLARLYLKDRENGTKDLEKAVSLDPTIKEIVTSLLAATYEDLMKDRGKAGHGMEHKHDHDEKDHDDQ